MHGDNDVTWVTNRLSFAAEDGNLGLVKGEIEEWHFMEASSFDLHVGEQRYTVIVWKRGPEE